MHVCMPFFWIHGKNRSAAKAQQFYRKLQKIFDPQSRPSSNFLSLRLLHAPRMIISVEFRGGRLGAVPFVWGMRAALGPQPGFDCHQRLDVSADIWEEEQRGYVDYQISKIILAREALHLDTSFRRRLRLRPVIFYSRKNISVIIQFWKDEYYSFTRATLA